MRLSKRSVLVPGLAALLLSVAAIGQAQQTARPNAPIAGTATKIIGVTVDEEVLVSHGWSVKRQILGKHVVNDQNEKLGKIEDLVVNPDKSMSYAIIGVGGFLGMGKHDIAVPVSQLRSEEDRFVLPNATKESVKAMPEFHYAK